MKTTLTSKGQLTLPKVVREALGLRAGDELVVRLEEGRIVLLPHHRYRARDLLELIPEAKVRYPGLDEEQQALVRALAEKEPQ
ncbi:MAG: AbrB/MazE/SpoVT family DNA-binding domain-containing protein [Truepera sp.]|nr:AbrB/MazE/SpoVT family DNA-binding domain-containing protein [Truepera sp.]MBS3968039.1 AbrB/MazE/SpoVT family DNA-binding domain-containing protein [Truepera sp.]MBS3968296.1 AbrB/MazE/SpoVT family DNA-binding domain-containing protein [Truepera sp.]